MFVTKARPVSYFLQIRLPILHVMHNIYLDIYSFGLKSEVKKYKFWIEPFRTLKN